MVRSEGAGELMVYVHQVLQEALGGAGAQWAGQVYVMDEDKEALMTVYAAGQGEREEVVLVGQTRVGRCAELKHSLFFTAVNPPTPSLRSNANVAEGLALVCIPLINDNGTCLGVLKFTRTPFSPRSVEHSVGLREVYGQMDGVIGEEFGRSISKNYGFFTRPQVVPSDSSSGMVYDALLRIHLSVHTILLVMQMAHHLTTILTLYQDRQREVREVDEFVDEEYGSARQQLMSPLSATRPLSPSLPSSPAHHIHRPGLGSLHLNTSVHTAVHTQQTQTHTPITSPANTRPLSPSPVAMAVQLRTAQEELSIVQSTMAILQSECDEVRQKYKQCMQESTVKDTRLREVTKELDKKEKELKE
eukprot:gene32810-39668_t